jgi:hypothetical protein
MPATAPSFSLQKPHSRFAVRCCRAARPIYRIYPRLKTKGAAVPLRLIFLTPFRSGASIAAAVARHATGDESLAALGRGLMVR